MISEDDATLKQVIVKSEPTGEWFATFDVQMARNPSEPPENPEKYVGIGVEILKHAYDTDGTAVESPDFSDECDRLEREQRKLSRKVDLLHALRSVESDHRISAECDV